MFTHVLLSSLLAASSPLVATTPSFIVPQIGASSTRRGKIVRIICIITRGKPKFC